MSSDIDAGSALVQTKAERQEAGASLGMLLPHSGESSWHPCWRRQEGRLGHGGRHTESIQRAPGQSHAGTDEEWKTVAVSTLGNCKSK